MRRSKFSETEIVTILKSVENGLPVAEVLRKHGISRATYFLWKAKYAGATVAELRRLRELEAENAKLKRMYAELALENSAIKDVLSRKL
jgi:putative transposase